MMATKLTQKQSWALTVLVQKCTLSKSWVLKMLIVDYINRHSYAALRMRKEHEQAVEYFRFLVELEAVRHNHTEAISNIEAFIKLKDHSNTSL